MNEYYKIFAWAECPYCINAKDLLTKSGKQFMLCCVDESPELLSYIKDKHNWMTVPMIIRFKRDGPCECKFGKVCFLEGTPGFFHFC